MDKDWVGNKKCTKCNLVKSNNEFYWHKTTNRYNSECKECTKKAVKKYREIHKEKIIEIRNRYKEKRKKIRYKVDRKSYLKSKYKITEEQYKIMYNQQNGLCLICNKYVEYPKLCIDHSHKNNKIRGLICRKCNLGIGIFEENIENLQKAIIYLRRYENE